AALFRKISASIASGGRMIVFEIRKQDLGCKATVGEDQRLLSAIEQLLGDAACLHQIAATDAELAIHHGRVIEDDVFIAARGAVTLHQLELLSREGFGELARIGDGRRATYELRLRSVELANPKQAAHYVRQMAAIHAAIGVQLIDHDEFEIFEQL